MKTWNSGWQRTQWLGVLCGDAVRIRARVVDPRSGRLREVNRILNHVAPEDAAEQRGLLREELRARLHDREVSTQSRRAMAASSSTLRHQPKDGLQMAEPIRGEPLTVRDAFSRFVLEIRAVPDTTTETVRSSFEALFSRYGLPAAIQSDNGQPFASTRALGGLTRLSAWWVSLGIALIRSRPGCPPDNGGHERMHADISIETQSLVAPTLAAQQRMCDDWRAEFNHVRPHEALGMKTPSEVYRASPRRPRPVGGDFPALCVLVKSQV